MNRLIPNNFHFIRDIIGLFKIYLFIFLFIFRTLFPSTVNESLSNEMFELAKLNKTIRPYNLTTEEFARLCQAYKTICEKNPQYYKFNYQNHSKSLEEEKEEEEWNEEEEKRTEAHRELLFNSYN